MKPNTSAERVQSLEHLSDPIYETIDDTVSGESRARKLLRLGINMIDDELSTGNDPSSTGEQLIALMHQQFAAEDLTLDHPAYAAFPRYRYYATALRKPALIPTTHLDSLANRYGDVTRATLDNRGNPETDARHAVHLMALAVPYAVQYYPDELDPGLVALNSLIHDFPEAISGDTPTFGLSHAEYQKKLAREATALGELQSELGSDHQELFAAIDRYEQQDHAEAQFVRQFDKEEPFFTHRLNRGQQLISYYGILSAAQFLESTVPTSERIAAYPRTFPLLSEDRLEFIRLLARNTEWPEAV